MFAGGLRSAFAGMTDLGSFPRKREPETAGPLQVRHRAALGFRGDDFFM